jgi:hypothetical protein
MRAGSPLDAARNLALMTDDVERIPMIDYKVDGRGPHRVSGTIARSRAL